MTGIHYQIIQELKSSHKPSPPPPQPVQIAAFAVFGNGPGGSSPATGIDIASELQVQLASNSTLRMKNLKEVYVLGAGLWYDAEFLAWPSRNSRTAPLRNRRDR